jgi:hypothetical protein
MAQFFDRRAAMLQHALGSSAASSTKCSIYLKALSPSITLSPPHFKLFLTARCALARVVTKNSCPFGGPQTMAKTILAFALFVQCIQQVASVDRSKFRTCDQTAFCRRNRNPEIPPPPYHIMKESITSGEMGVSVLLEGEHPEAPQYKMDIKFYDSGVSRIQVNTCEKYWDIYAIFLFLCFIMHAWVCFL